MHCYMTKRTYVVDKLNSAIPIMKNCISADKYQDQLMHFKRKKNLKILNTCFRA